MEMDSGKDLHLGLGKRKRNDEGTSLGEGAIPDDGSCCPPLLPKHKIFLSHSGKQKWFVEKLCEDLEARHRFPFFDKRPSSLPKGERFPKLILEAAERCEMAVVVVSEEFLTSKWPMMELSTFVRALSGSNPGLKILPLFFGMSISDLGSESKQGAWLKLWNEWERNDPRILVAEFEKALKVMRSFNGIVFDGDMNNVWSYERDVVKEICSVVGPDVKWEDSDVQGRSSICEDHGGSGTIQATRAKMKVIKPAMNGVCVFGYYGMGGIGKTTMCKTLCNELSEFSGKVCHVELGGTRSVEQMLKEVVRKLTNTSDEVLERLDEGECRSILTNRSSRRERTFLAIDNVWDDNKSMVQAKMFMQDLAFHEGSVVMVTSRCRRTLTRVGVEESHCFGVPELGEEDARKLFLYHVAGEKQFDNEEDYVVINKCISRCRFEKGGTQGFHYLPLALKMLGIHLGFVGSSPAEWLKGLPEVRDFNRFEGDNPVFSIIRMNYDRLSLQFQALFMDVAVFQRKGLWEGEFGLEGYFGWLSVVHEQKLQETQSQLQQLKERGLLEDVDMESETVSMHDLYKEFAMMEAKGKFNSSAGLNNRMWVYYEGLCPLDLERTPCGECWENLIRVHVKMHDEDSVSDLDLDLDGCKDGQVVYNLQRIKWRYFANLVLLTVRVNFKVTGFLNLEGLQCLRSLKLFGFRGIDGVDGLEDLNNLKYFEWNGVSYDELGGSPSLGQLPASLRILKLLHLGVCLRSDMFNCCTNLSDLLLIGLEASGQIDLRQCSYLRKVTVRIIGGLHTLLILPTGLQSCLQFLLIEECKDLSCISGLGELVRLESLEVCYNSLMEEVPDLEKCTSLQILRVSGVPIKNCVDGVRKCQFVELHGLGSLQQLREINFDDLYTRELPNLKALKHLDVLIIRRCKKLSLLDGVEGLTALRHVDLGGCELLSRLPDLSNSTKLETLDLWGSGIVLHEEDIVMLATLHGLRSVGIGYSSESWGRYTCIKLDPVRRKVVLLERHGHRVVDIGDSFEYGPRYIRLDPIKRNVLFQDPYYYKVVDERDLETLPIQLYDYKF